MPTDRNRSPKKPSSRASIWPLARVTRYYQGRDLTVGAQGLLHLRR
ncbi:MAG: hypothetical protein R3E96_15225 [Planctomycetota bacterium]